jgi:predicted Zn-dependent protease
MKRKHWVLLAALAVLGVGATLGLQGWRKFVVERQDARAWQRAKDLLQEGRGEEALSLVDSRKNEASKRDWGALELDALAAAFQVSRLAGIYQRDPESVLRHEEACLLLARASHSARKKDDFARIRQAWQGHEGKSHLWLALDSDVLAWSNQPHEAAKLLANQKFSGAAEATRLVRLALLSANRNLEESWKLLDQANLLDPRNPDIHSFRAQILEAIQKPAEARVEYVAALVAAPKNPLLRDQLAEFYRRQGDYDHALRTWEESLPAPSIDYLWVKTLFWGRVVQPASIGTGKLAPPAGELEPLARWLLALGPGRFWDGDSFAQLPHNRQFTDRRQELYWLRVLDHLQANRPPEAMDLLKYSRFRTGSWQPHLEMALQRILYFRLKGSLNPPDLQRAAARTNQHQFFAQLETAAEQERKTGKLDLSPELRQVLAGREAFAAACLAAGWREAALQFLAGEGALPPLPDWLAYGLAQALRFNRTPAAALGFLAAQPATPTLNLLSGELLLGLGKVQEGLGQLARLARLDADAGQRAAWLLAMASLERGRCAEARQWIQDQPRLAQATIGRELLARAALMEGKKAEADQLYQAIGPDSAEAKAHLARLAFAAKNWAEARRLTQELMRLLPDELQLRQNLVAIEKAEAGK